jgi:putative transposase
MERKMVAQTFVDQGCPLSAVLAATGLARSTFYYAPREGGRRPGRPLSTLTLKGDGTWAQNPRVAADIKAILGMEFVDYGYLKVTHALRQDFGYVINPKKVYGIMAREGLLTRPQASNRGCRNWVKDLVPSPEGFFSYLEFDIKYIWVQGLRRNAMALTVIDVYSRMVLGHTIAWTISKHDVVRLFTRIFGHFGTPNRFFVRNDNGSQMAAQLVQDYFRGVEGVTQEFTKPATPQQNAHIESYHSILERAVCQRFMLQDIQDLIYTMDRWLVFYGFKRIHSGIGYLCPYKFLLQKGVDLKPGLPLLEVLVCSNAKLTDLNNKLVQYLGV